MDRGAWWAMVHGFEKSQTWLKWLSRHACKWNLNQLFKKSWATYGSWRYMRLFLPWEWGVVLHDLCMLVTPLGTQSDPHHGQSWTLKSCTNTRFFRVGIDFSQNFQEWVCVCVCARTCMCAGSTQGLRFLWTACSICVILVPVWSVGFGRAQQTVRLLRELVSIPCTLVEIPRTTKAHQQENDSSSTYWAPTMCWAWLDALCMHWHLKLLQQPLWEVVSLCEMTAIIITILQMRILRQQEVKHLLAPDHTASKWWGWDLNHHAL